MPEGKGRWRPRHQVRQAAEESLAELATLGRTSSAAFKRSYRWAVPVLIAIISVALLCVVILARIHSSLTQGGSTSAAWGFGAVTVVAFLLWLFFRGRRAVTQGEKSPLEQAAAWATIISLVVMILIFGVEQLQWALEREAPKPQVVPLVFEVDVKGHADAGATTTLPVIRIGPFGSGSAELDSCAKAAKDQPDGTLCQAVCRAREALQSAAASAVLVVGRHDKQELSRQAETRYSSNIGLAQRRADAVAAVLADPAACASGIRTIDVAATIIGGPRAVGVARGDRNMAFDRTVEIYGLSVRQARAR